MLKHLEQELMLLVLLVLWPLVVLLLLPLQPSRAGLQFWQMPVAMFCLGLVQLST
jgi:hypothetical protein